ncbi:MAG: glycosyltransferase [Phycisphaerae bacterium]
MREGRPILVLTASTGAGHNTAARAIEAALHAAVPDQIVEYHDVLESAGRCFRGFYGGGYRALVRHLPCAMGWLYERADQPNRPLETRVHKAVQTALTGGIARYIEQRRPRLVINTHYLPGDIVARLRLLGRLDCPQVVVTTDFETHRIWVNACTERYYTATAMGREYLRQCGAPGERVLVTGIPVRPGFEQPPERDALRARLGLDGEGPVVLLLAGGVGYSRPERLVEELIHMPADAQIAVVAGKNERLQRRCEDLARRTPRRVVVSGYTDRVFEWMHAADLMVSKPGGLTTSEALVCGLPLVLVDPIPGQETRNADYLLEHGAAIKVNDPRLLGHRVSQLLTTPTQLERRRVAARTLARPGAAGRIVADALSLLPDSPAAPAPAADPGPPSTARVPSV